MVEWYRIYNIWYIVSCIEYPELKDLLGRIVPGMIILTNIYLLFGSDLVPANLDISLIYKDYTTPGSEVHGF